MAAPVRAELLQVDIRGLSLEDRRAAVARVLDELRSGRRVILVTDRDPKPLLTTFRQMHQGEIYCTITVVAADCFRSDLQLRRPEQRLTLAEHLRADHARIDGLLTELQHFLRVGVLAEADRRFVAQASHGRRGGIALSGAATHDRARGGRRAWHARRAWRAARSSA